MMADTERPGALAGASGSINQVVSSDRFDSTGTSQTEASRASSGRLTVIAEVIDGEEPRRIRVRGQTARCLLALVKHGPKGRTALEVSSWALRFAAYCHHFIRRHGLVIRTDREHHPGGWHGRHVLVTPIRIVAVSGRIQNDTGA
jgi:hypothetical protein